MTEIPSFSEDFEDALVNTRDGRIDDTASKHLIITANDYTLRHDPDRDQQQWTAVSPSGRLGDYASGDEALAAVLDDQARRLQGEAGPVVTMVFVKEEKPE